MVGRLPELGWGPPCLPRVSWLGGGGRLETQTPQLSLPFLGGLRGSLDRV